MASLKDKNKSAKSKESTTEKHSETENLSSPAA